MILRYSVETRHRPAFTASKRSDDIFLLYEKVQSLIKANEKAGHKKYSGFILYSNENVEIMRITD